MRLSMLPRTIGFSLAREILVYSSIGFMTITLILLSQNALRHLEQLVRVGFEWRDMAVALRALAVMFMAYALPLPFLLGALFAIRRMKSDAELLAMQSCGLGVGALLAATLSIGVGISGLTAFLIIDAEHVARRDMRTLLMNVAARGNIIEPGRFQQIGNRVGQSVLHIRQNVGRGVQGDAGVGRRVLLRQRRTPPRTLDGDIGLR